MQEESMSFSPFQLKGTGTMVLGKRGGVRWEPFPQVTLLQEEKQETLQKNTIPLGQLAGLLREISALYSNGSFAEDGNDDGASAGPDVAFQMEDLLPGA